MNVTHPSRACLYLVPFALAASLATHGVLAQTRYVALATDRMPPRDSCVLVHSRADLAAALKAAGYLQPQLPAIPWGTAGAAVIALHDEATEPAFYVPSSPQRREVLVRVRPRLSPSPHVVYVMQVDQLSANATACTGVTIDISGRTETYTIGPRIHF